MLHTSTVRSATVWSVCAVPVAEIEWIEHRPETCRAQLEYNLSHASARCKCNVQLYSAVSDTHTSVDVEPRRDRTYLLPWYGLRILFVTPSELDLPYTLDCRVSCHDFRSVTSVS